MEITKEQFEQAIAKLATKDDIQNAKDELLFRLCVSAGVKIPI
jgi:hypothetical protein